MNIFVRKSGVGDIELLARLNKKLIDSEVSRNPMSIQNSR